MGWPPIHNGDGMATILSVKWKGNGMATSPLSLKGNVDGMATSAFYLKCNRHGMAIDPFDL